MTSVYGRVDNLAWLHRAVMAWVIPAISTAVLAGCASTPTEVADLPVEASEVSPLSINPETEPPSPMTNAAESAGELSAVESGSADESLTTIRLYGELASAADASGPVNDEPEPRQITTAGRGVCVDPDIDRTGAWLAFASTMNGKTSDIYLQSLDAGTVRRVTTDRSDDVMPAFSPDGRQIAFASNRTGNWNIYVTDLEGDALQQVTDGEEQELHPTWSPDASLLAYCKFGAHSGQWEIWVTESAAPRSPRFVEYGVFPQWCPDPARSKILFQRAKAQGGRSHSIWTVDLVDGQAHHAIEVASAPNAALINPAWSPDADRIVFVAAFDADDQSQALPVQSDVWVMNQDGSGRMMLTEGAHINFQPVWSAQGTLYFVSDRSGMDHVWAMAVSGLRDVAPTGSTGIATAESTTDDSGPHP